MKSLIINFFTSTYSVKLIITILIILFIIIQFTRNQEKLIWQGISGKNTLITTGIELKTNAV